MTPREIEAICANYNYQPIIKLTPIDKETTYSYWRHQPNPETAEQFAQRNVDNFIADNVRSYELKLVRVKAEADYEADPTAALAAVKSQAGVLK